MQYVIVAITPDAAGFDELKAESLTKNFNMLHRLDAGWRSGENRFETPGEKLLGLYIDDRLAGVCGLNRDPFSKCARAGRIRHLYLSKQHRGTGAGRHLLLAVMSGAAGAFDYLNTHAPASASGFYLRMGSTAVVDEPRITHRIFCRA